MSRIKEEIKRFIIVGCSAVATDALVYALLISVWPASAAKAVSFISGTVVAFLFNKYWTFQQHKFCHNEIIRFMVLYLVTFCANVAVNKAVLLVFPEGITFAFLCATGTSTILNFTGQKFWVFIPVTKSVNKSVNI